MLLPAAVKDKQPDLIYMNVMSDSDVFCSDNLNK